MRYLSFLIIFYACTSNPPISKEIKSETQIETNYSTKIFRNNDGSFGYDLLKDTVLIIRQKTIPVKSGLSGFKDSISAVRVAAFALSIIESGSFPPTIQESEIDSILKIK